MANQTLKIDQGSTWSQSFLVDPLLMVDDTWNVLAQVRADTSSATSLHEWSTANENVELVDGVLTLTVDASVSEIWAWTNGVYDLHVSKGTVDYKIMSGSVFVRPRVSRT